MTLFGDFLRDDHRRTHKWYQYFPAYETHLARFRNRHVTLFEIGVGEGGSLEQWRAYLGPFAIIVGLDSYNMCAQLEEEDTHIRIGKQEDTEFLAKVVEEFGAPDIVIDDGSHLQPQLTATFDFLYPRVAKNGVYLVEDLHAAYWPDHGGGIRRPASFIEHAKRYVDEMHAEYVYVSEPGDEQPRTLLGDRTRSIHFYDSLIVMEVGEYRVKRHRMTGRPEKFRSDWTPGVPAEAPGAPVPETPVPETPVPVTPVLAAASDSALQQRVQALENEIAVVRASTSWRMTGPLRAVGRLFKG